MNLKQAFLIAITLLFLAVEAACIFGPGLMKFLKAWGNQRTETHFTTK